MSTYLSIHQSSVCLHTHIYIYIYIYKRCFLYMSIINFVLLILLEEHNIDQITRSELVSMSVDALQSIFIYFLIMWGCCLELGHFHIFFKHEKVTAWLLTCFHIYFLPCLESNIYGNPSDFWPTVMRGRVRMVWVQGTGGNGWGEGLVGISQMRGHLANHRCCFINSSWIVYDQRLTMIQSALKG